MAEEAIPVQEKVEEALSAAPPSTLDKAKKTVSDTAEHVHKSHIVTMTHQALLASIGAGVLAKEETEKFLKVLIERGTIAETESRKMMKEAMEQRKKATKRAMRGAKKAEVEMDKRVEDVLARMNIPTKTEIEALSAKITTLTKKVDELKKAQ
jgi:poly(hydroxyalkanoate) granule-associated protein